MLVYRRVNLLVSFHLTEVLELQTLGSANVKSDKMMRFYLETMFFYLPKGLSAILFARLESVEQMGLQPSGSSTLFTTFEASKAHWLWVHNIDYIDSQHV
jgi:hypothetical protein